jgi:hypothetical protein
VTCLTAVYRGGDAFCELVGTRKKRVMPGAELDKSHIPVDMLTLRLGRGGEILGADEVRGGFLLPGDLATSAIASRHAWTSS